MRRVLVAASALSALTTPVQMAVAQRTGLEDMVGTRAGQAESELQRRGYRYVGGSQGDDRSYSNWWNADRRQCVTIATMDGRYSSITPTTAPDCLRSSSMRPRPDYEQPATRPRPGYPQDPAFSRPAPQPGFGQPNLPIVNGQSVDLGLVCFGDGRKDGLATGSSWTWNSRRDRYEHGTYTETRPEIFDASLMIQIWGDSGRIRLPKSLIPPLNSRGQNGWWDLYDVRVNSDVIAATYRLNGLNKPKVMIDRRSGRITVQGFSDYGFRGTCDQIGTGGRRF